ncbi:hypothetical protein BDW74DRAFT_161858 [Aspergillus multicolor]|uniref:uncharacterized protein n=1 Tax=Aspergillus multicolor TaxID=41759 RepID=UPI003CCCE1D0
MIPVSILFDLIAGLAIAVLVLVLLAAPCRARVSRSLDQSCCPCASLDVLSPRPRAVPSSLVSLL